MAGGTSRGPLAGAETAVDGLHDLVCAEADGDALFDEKAGIGELTSPAGTAGYPDRGRFKALRPRRETELASSADRSPGSTRVRCRIEREGQRLLRLAGCAAPLVPARDLDVEAQRRARVEISRVAAKVLVQ